MCNEMYMYMYIYYIYYIYIYIYIYNGAISADTCIRACSNARRDCDYRFDWVVWSIVPSRTMIFSEATIIYYRSTFWLRPCNWFVSEKSQSFTGTEFYLARSKRDTAVRTARGILCTSASWQNCIVRCTLSDNDLSRVLEEAIGEPTLVSEAAIIATEIRELARSPLFSFLALLHGGIFGCKDEAGQTPPMRGCVCPASSLHAITRKHVAASRGAFHWKFVANEPREDGASK